MFNRFVRKLKTRNGNEVDEWRSVLGDEDIFPEDPVLFWYLSSGIDTKTFAHFNQREMDNVHGLPSVDVFVFSDYWRENVVKIEEYYRQLDHGPVRLFEDERTLVRLEQVIPLVWFDDDARRRINSKHHGARRATHVKDVLPASTDFFYCLFTVESNLFGDEYFPVLWTPIENWTLSEELWNPLGVTFTYFCAICDGCRKGGAWKCVNHDIDFFVRHATTPAFWVTDHNPPHHKRPLVKFNGWGHYRDSSFGNPKIASRMYRVR